MKTAILTDGEFQTLLGGGFFDLILRHPEVCVYRTTTSIVVLIPGKGAVEIAARP